MKTKANHHPEPWKYAPAQHGTVFGGRVEDAHGDLICQMSHHPAERDEAKANAARIVACVNGCKGINPEAVADLFNACELAEGYIDAQSSNSDCLWTARDQWLLETIRAALARAKGDA